MTGSQSPVFGPVASTQEKLRPPIANPRSVHVCHSSPLSVSSHAPPLTRVYPSCFQWSPEQAAVDELRTSTCRAASVGEEGEVLRPCTSASAATSATDTPTCSGSTRDSERWVCTKPNECPRGMAGPRFLDLPRRELRIAVDVKL